MLKVSHISKKYVTGDLTQLALDDVSVNFRDNEFVAVLGPSGSGKTTLLNIVGGLDRYDSGDLIINTISTKKYKDRDWDSYRNHTIGFVFQSYNLIPHQSILSNVELALTISGVSKKERKQRAREALEKVGLGDQLHKKPNQMSGGQMQRVAIARALVNNPDILLADEPTGALDSETSTQVMALLKEVAQDRLVIMVTHNPEIAGEYANRIVRLKDGKIIDDSNPFEIDEAAEKPAEHKRMGKTSMSFLTALSLSLNNLRTKKARTILTAFAGSIGIIGIAMILSLSNGINEYIDNVQKDTLSTYPLTITKESVDFTSMMAAMMESNNKDGIEHGLDKVYSNNIITNMLATMSQEMTSNDLPAFRQYIESGESKLMDYISAVQYGYDLELQIYSADTSEGILQLNPSEILDSMSMGGGSMGGSEDDSSSSSMDQMFSLGGLFTEMLDNQKLLDSQYDVLEGRFPDEGAYNEVVITVDKNNEISDTSLYAIGLMDQKEYKEILQSVMMGKEVSQPEQAIFSYEEIVGTSFKLLLNTDYYKYNEADGTWEDMRENNSYMKNLVDNALELKVVGIVRPNKDASAVSIPGTIGYTSALTRYVADKINDSEIAKTQLADPDTNILTGMPFNLDSYTDNLTMEDIMAYMETLPEEVRVQYQQMAATMSEDELLEMFAQQIKRDNADEASYETNLKKLGIVNLNEPSVINIYPLDFEAKDSIVDIIEKYNDEKTAAGHEEQAIAYTDLVGLMMSSITTIINMISYVLIGFVAISLVVSSIMIGIITFISVLERTKEIGVLRSIGASKRNISSIFNAETVIEGFIAGIIGILVTVILIIPANAIIESFSGVSNLAKLPWAGGVILIIISVILTLIAGIIPSKKAAKQDPVAALRTE